MKMEGGMFCVPVSFSNQLLKIHQIQGIKESEHGGNNLHGRKPRENLLESMNETLVINSKLFLANCN